MGFKPSTNPSRNPQFFQNHTGGFNLYVVILDFSPELALTGFKTRPHIDGFKNRPHINETRRYEDGLFKTVNASTVFKTCLAEKRFIKPVIANTGLFNLS